MAGNKEISALTAMTVYAEADLLVGVDVSEAAPEDQNKKLTKTVLFDSLPDFGSGLTFGNETLDQYDEGSWTPTIAFSGGDGDLSYTVQVGRYTRIGRAVLVTGSVQFSETTASGDCELTNLPFTSLTLTDHPPSGGIVFGNMTGLTGGTTWEIASNTSLVKLLQTGTGNITRVTDSNTAANAFVRFSIMYIL